MSKIDENDFDEASCQEEQNINSIPQFNQNESKLVDKGDYSQKIKMDQNGVGVSYDKRGQSTHFAEDKVIYRKGPQGDANCRDPVNNFQNNLPFINPQHNTFFSGERPLPNIDTFGPITSYLKQQYELTFNRLAMSEFFRIKGSQNRDISQNAIPSGASALADIKPQITDGRKDNLIQFKNKRVSCQVNNRNDINKINCIQADNISPLIHSVKIVGRDQKNLKDASDESFQPIATDKVNMPYQTGRFIPSKVTRVTDINAQEVLLDFHQIPRLNEDKYLGCQTFSPGYESAAANCDNDTEQQVHQFQPNYECYASPRQQKQQSVNSSSSSVSIIEESWEAAENYPRIVDLPKDHIKQIDFSAMGLQQMPAIEEAEQEKELENSQRPLKLNNDIYAAEFSFQKENNLKDSQKLSLKEDLKIIKNIDDPSQIYNLENIQGLSPYLSQGDNSWQDLCRMGLCSNSIMPSVQGAQSRLQIGSLQTPILRVSSNQAGSRFQIIGKSKRCVFLHSKFKNPRQPLNNRPSSSGINQFDIKCEDCSDEQADEDQPMNLNLLLNQISLPMDYFHDSDLRSGLDRTLNKTSNNSQFFKNQQRSVRNRQLSNNLLFVGKSNRGNSKSSESGGPLFKDASEFNWRIQDKDLEIRETPLEDQEDSLLEQIYLFESPSVSQQIQKSNLQ